MQRAASSSSVSNLVDISQATANAIDRPQRPAGRIDQFVTAVTAVGIG
jgi:hypothetical protein